MMTLNKARRLAVAALARLDQGNGNGNEQDAGGGAVTFRDDLTACSRTGWRFATDAVAVTVSHSGAVNVSRIDVVDLALEATQPALADEPALSPSPVPSPGARRANTEPLPVTMRSPVR